MATQPAKPRRKPAHATPRSAGKSAPAAGRSAPTRAAKSKPTYRPIARPTHRRTRRPPRRRWAVTAAALLVLAALLAGGAYLWLNRSVSVSVNGSLAEVKVGSTLADIMAAQGLSYTSGNLLSVSGALIAEGEGAPYTVTVNGRELAPQEAEGFRAGGGEVISFANGADVTESSHEEVRETQPLMEFAGRSGAVTYVEQYGRAGQQRYTIGDVSGEEIAGEETQPVQNVVIRSVNPSPSDGSKVVALTFDDGPSAYTQDILDILSAHGARATFFCLGRQAANNPQAVQAIVAQGSQVASHTQSHQQLTSLGTDDLRSELTKAFANISSAGGGDTTVIRPPYGSFDRSTWLASGGDLSASVIWNLDSCDWQLPGADAIVANCTNGAFSGAIILMHDGGGNREQTVEALPRILKTLQDQGYRFVTVNELMAMDDSIPKSVAAGNATIPEGHAWATQMAE